MRVSAHSSYLCPTRRSCARTSILCMSELWHIYLLFGPQLIIQSLGVCQVCQPVVLANEKMNWLCDFGEVIAGWVLCAIFLHIPFLAVVELTELVTPDQLSEVVEIFNTGAAGETGDIIRNSLHVVH